MIFELLRTFRNIQKQKKTGLTPELLINKIRKHGHRKFSHVHVYFSGMSDHVLLICPKTRFERIAAKTTECEKGVCVELRDSAFFRYSPENVLDDLSEHIERVKIEDSGKEKEWTLLELFAR